MSDTASIPDETPRYVPLASRADWLVAHVRQPERPTPVALVDGMFGVKVSSHPQCVTVRLEDGTERFLRWPEFFAALAEADKDQAAAQAFLAQRRTT